MAPSAVVVPTALENAASTTVFSPKRQRDRCDGEIPRKPGCSPPVLPAIHSVSTIAASPRRCARKWRLLSSGRPAMLSSSHASVKADPLRRSESPICCNGSWDARFCLVHLVQRSDWVCPRGCLVTSCRTRQLLGASRCRRASSVQVTSITAPLCSVILTSTEALGGVSVLEPLMHSSDTGGRRRAEEPSRADGPRHTVASPTPNRFAPACRAFPSAADPLPQRAAELQRSFGPFVYLWYNSFSAVNRTELETMEAFYAP